MKVLRKTVIAALLCVSLLGFAQEALCYQEDPLAYVTVTEAPANQNSIFPTSTRWKVLRGGRLRPISALRAKYMRVATYHGSPPAINVYPPEYAAYYPPQPLMTIPEPNYYSPAQSYAPPQQPVYPPAQNYAPPQQPVYPPAQSYAPPQQPVYPPAQSYAPPQQPVYPPAQSYAPPQQPVYPPAQNYAPQQQPVRPPAQNYAPQQQPVYPPAQDYTPPQQPVRPPAQNYAPPQTDSDVLRNAVPGQQFVPSGRAYRPDPERPSQNYERVQPGQSALPAAPYKSEWDYAPTQRYYPPAAE